MKNLKVGKKLMVVFGILLFCFLASGITGLLCVIRVNNNLSQFYSVSYQTVATELDARMTLQSFAKNMLWANSATSADDTKTYLDAADSDWQTLQKDLPALEQKYPGSAKNIKQVEDLIQKASPYRDQVKTALQEGNKTQAYQIFNENYAPLSVQARGLLDRIGQEVSAQATQSFQDGQMVTRYALILLILIALVSLILMAVFCVYITRAITRPITEIKAAAEELANGNLGAFISYQSRDELGALSVSMRQTINSLKGYIGEISRVFHELSNGNLQIEPRTEFKGSFIELEHNVTAAILEINDVLTQINHSAEQVAVGANQVSDGAQALSQGTTEQASSLEELTSAITQISSRVDENAQNAVKSSEQANSIGGQLSVSNEKMQNLIAAMGQISNNSKEIEKINKTVADIAFQTNILALNASVEAARAGEAGRGFAVVAEEVRNLAAKSAEASKETERLVFTAMEAANNGVRIVDETANSISVVVDEVNGNIQSLGKISAASQEQAQAIEQITRGLDQITAVVQNNSATAEESAASSEELLSLAQLLKGLVGHFELRGNKSGEPTFVR